MEGRDLHTNMWPRRQKALRPRGKERRRAAVPGAAHSGAAGTAGRILVLGKTAILNISRLQRFVST